MKELMIRMQGVEKRYQLGKISSTTLQHEIQSYLAKRKGQSDPNRKLFKREENGSFLALKNVDLEIYKGETLGIIGKNGAGKSTLLKLLSRITAPSAGKIDIYGRIASMLEVGTGFDGELTGRENIYLNGAILGMKRAEIDRKIKDIIAYSELEQFIDTPIKRYSSGMYTKLGFAVAANLDSEILIMDEVLAVGDIDFQNKCIARMKEAAANENKTVLYVSHNMDQVRSLCSRCIVLDKGQIIFDGETEEAIGYYLNRKAHEHQAQDYTCYQRPSWLQDERMRLVRAAYLDRNNGIYRRTDKPLVELVWQAYEDLENIGLRIEVHSGTDQVIGTYVYYDVADQKKDEQVRISVEMNVGALQNGTYDTIYCFFLCDGSGNNHNLDRVEGLSFTIEDQEEGKLIWDKRNWGHLELEGRQWK